LREVREERKHRAENYGKANRERAKKGGGGKKLGGKQERF